MLYGSLGYERRLHQTGPQFSGLGWKGRKAPGPEEAPQGEPSVEAVVVSTGSTSPVRTKTRHLLQKLGISKTSNPANAEASGGETDQRESGTPDERRKPLAFLKWPGRKKRAVEKNEAPPPGSRLGRVARKTVENGGQAIAWTGILMTTGIILPGRPKDVIPVAIHLNAGLLSLLLPEPVVASLYEKSLSKGKGTASSKDGNPSGPDEIPPQENMVDTLVNSAAAQRIVSWSKALEQKPWFQSHVAPVGRRLGELPATHWSYRQIKGLKAWVIDHGPAQRIAHTVTNPFIKPSTAVYRFHQENRAQDETVVAGKYAEVSVRKRDKRFRQLVKDMTAAYKGEPVPFRPKGEEVISVQLNLPPGTATKSELEARLAEDVEKSFHTALEQRASAQKAFNKGETSAWRKKWATRALAVPALWGALNLAWIEGPRVAWTEFHAGYETLGEIRKTYEIFGQPTGIPELHPEAYIVAPTDPKCLVEIVDAWTKMRWWCVVSGATMKELHRLPVIPIFNTHLDFLDQPIAGGFHSGRVVPSVENTAVMEVHPENEFWDPGEEDPYDFWVERFHETVVRQLPIARIVLKRPEEIADPALRDLMNSFYTMTPKGVQITQDGMAIVSAIAGLALDKSYESVDTNTDDK